MEYVVYPVISIYELEEAIKLQYGIDIDLENIFWREREQNYIYCYYRELDWVNEEDDEYTILNVICNYLRDTIPEHDACLIER